VGSGRANDLTPAPRSEEQAKEQGAPVDLSEKTKLEKLLGMLGSSFDGERANAARMIAAMAEKKRLTIIELIYGSAPARAASRRATKTWKPRDDLHDTILQRLRDITSGDMSDLEFVLTQWECDFATDVVKRYSFDYELTEKQIVVAEKIVRKVELARSAQ
jgi:hypothetical protein